MAARLRRPLVLLLGAGLVASATVSAAAPSSARARSTAQTRSLSDALSADGPGEASTLPARTTRLTKPEDRYAMAGGCYAVRSVAAQAYVVRQASSFVATGTKATAERYHFQAMDLGKYLLFASKSDFLAKQSAPLSGTGIVAAATPSAAAEWVVTKVAPGQFVLQMAVDDGDEAVAGPLNPPIAGTLVSTAAGVLSVASGALTSAAARFGFERASGCAAWPEIETGVTGKQATRGTSYEESRGYVDAHLHMMAFEFLGGRVRCGRPWHPYGVSYALVDCPDHVAGGRGAVLEDVVSGHTPGQGHDTVGWPTFGYWPHYDSLTHEQVYYKWLERAWRGGLRMFTNLLVDNHALCMAYPLKKNSCNEMDGVRLQATRLHELARYIDAQNGGPGRGWFQIVKDPFEARRVMNAGKLAVVMGIEVSTPFDCGETLEVPLCTDAELNTRLDEVYALGVRQMELTNKFDNALTGVTGDGGSTGVVVNGGNETTTGHFWKMTTCVKPADATATDNTQYNVPDMAPGNVGRDGIFSAVLQVSGASGAAPVYPAGAHCNVIGLTNLGKRAIDGLMKRGMVFDPDHMSAAARRESIDYVIAHHYSGLVSSHSWADDPTYRRIIQNGGVVTPHAGGADGFVEKWRKMLTWRSSCYTFGVGYGSDINGFSKQGAPRKPVAAKAVHYPFTGMGGVRIAKQVSGQRTYDFNVDGVDHYGLYPDWVADGAIVAGKDSAAYVADVQRAPEAFLQMWERGIGIKGRSCANDTSDVSTTVVSGLANATPQQVLVALGQPDSRTGNQFVYGVGHGNVVITFDSTGHVRGTTVFDPSHPTRPGGGNGLPATGGLGAYAALAVLLSGCGVLALRLRRARRTRRA